MVLGGVLPQILHPGHLIRLTPVPTLVSHVFSGFRPGPGKGRRAPRQGGDVRHSWERSVTPGSVSGTDK